MKNFKSIFICLWGAALACTPLDNSQVDETTQTVDPQPAAMVTVISQHGITWTFDAVYPTGQFANGDYYVVGPAKVIAVNPPAKQNDTGRWMNGAMVNPPGGTTINGYDSALLAQSYEQSVYHHDLNVAAHLPYTCRPGDSLISVVSLPDPLAVPLIKTAAVLTCLDHAPLPGSFRPAYTGADRAVRFNESQLLYARLLKLPRFSDTPDLDEFTASFDGLRLDHMAGWATMWLHPQDFMPDYGAPLAAQNGAAALLLNSDFSDFEKRTLLIRLVQYGIDLYGIATDGYGRYNWQGAGGHDSGRLLPILFAGALLNDAAMLNVRSFQPEIMFGEIGQTYTGLGWTGATALYRVMGYTGTFYEHKHPSTWTQYIENRPVEGPSDKRQEDYRLCCGSSAWVAEALVFEVMELQLFVDHPVFFAYVDRWMNESLPQLYAMMNPYLENPYPDWWAQNFREQGVTGRSATGELFVEDLWDQFHGARAGF